MLCLRRSSGWTPPDPGLLFAPWGSVSGGRTPKGGFPKIGDPSVVPQIVGTLLYGSQHKVS